MRSLIVTQVVTIAIAGLSSIAVAQIDSIHVLVNEETASGSNSLATFAYLETIDENNEIVKTIYSTTFNAGGALRRITNVDGVQQVEVIATEQNFREFYTNNDPTRGVPNPLVFGMITNPAAVGSIPANGAIWFTDGSTTNVSGGGTADPAATKRVYRYNLGTIPSGGTGLDIFTSLATLSTFQAQPGGVGNISRQAAFSPTGQSIYHVDSGGSQSGVFKIDPASGAVTRILNIANSSGSVAINTEPAVLRVGDADRILFRGNKQSTAAPGINVGGINYIDHDGTNTTAQKTFLSAETLADFLQVAVGSTDVRAITAAPDGESIYFYDQSTSRLLGLDAEGRLFKLATRNERDLVLTGAVGAGETPTASVLRLQPRTIVHPTAGSIPQLMYAESSPLNSVGAIDVFLPTDFDRDGDEDATDLDLFETVLTPRNVAASLDNARFDLNGNAVIDFKDVKIAQSFQLFSDGDTNFDFAVNFDDLLTLAQGYGTATGQTWIDGDFTGDDAVNFDDLLILAQHYGETAPNVGLSALPSDFRSDWALALSTVPEPGVVTVLAAGLPLARRRIRRV
jgi:hypothetical protein